MGVPDTRSVTSSHLKRLDLLGILFCGSVLDLSCCPALEDLEIADSDLSLIHSAMESRVPVLGSMPELVLAYVIVGYGVDFCLSCDDPISCNHVMAAGSCATSWDDEGAEELSDAEDEDTRECVLLSGLSEATYLALISDNTNVDFQYKVHLKGRLDPTERSVATSKHLKIVEVKCAVVNEEVLELLNFTSALSIYPEGMPSKGWERAKKPLLAMIFGGSGIDDLLDTVLEHLASCR
ncbi:hypothetical protein PR202_gb16273 [Eleusine coracana subsp. coracana]|uniref:Uncharacterized protein n=1 Tax=Eleusine coracana subsp. coracana TaxID=191504 RepID=A0AAV5F0G7_ELECO|nr:hypothetical protein PR202_gb16273 [Eleusine coracana subsp. coracana]